MPIPWISRAEREPPAERTPILVYCPNRPHYYVAESVMTRLSREATHWTPLNPPSEGDEKS